MSEFSETYHLRGTFEDAVNLLRLARLPGFVFKARQGWVTILPAGEIFVPNHRLVDANSSLLIRFFFAGDHGWGFSTYQAQVSIGEFEVEWGDDLVIKRPCESGLITFAPHLAPEEVEALVAMLNRDDYELAIGDENAEAFAGAVGSLTTAGPHTIAPSTTTPTRC